MRYCPESVHPNYDVTLDGQRFLVVRYDDRVAAKRIVVNSIGRKNLRVKSLTMSRQDEETISRWSESAPYWEKHREVIRKMFAPITEALTKDVDVASNSAVLDVATGPGEPGIEHRRRARTRRQGAWHRSCSRDGRGRSSSGRPPLLEECAI